MFELISPMLDATAIGKLLIPSIVLITVGLLVNGFTNFMLDRFFKNSSRPHLRYLLKRLTKYLVLLAVLFSLLVIFGVDSKLLFGAAGIISVGAGFAARGVISNVVSGFVLLTERPFKVGDLVRIKETEGEVIAIDLLAVRIATFDNLMVRVPNDLINGSTMTNLSHFPIRRIDIDLVLDLEQPIDDLETTLNEVANAEPLVLAEPQVRIQFEKFATDAQYIRFCAWALQQDYLPARTALFSRITAHFEDGTLRRPSQQLHVRESSKSAPFLRRD